MSNANKYPAFTVAGRLAADPELRYTPKGTAVLEFRVIANATRENLAPVGVKAIVYGKRAESAKEKLAKGTLCELAGDVILEAYTDKEGAARPSLKLEVAFGKIVTFDENNKPVKTSLFAKEEAGE